jgi:hypothetical protein
VWQLLEQYRDVITNGLDLISFLFVTPELLRFTQLILGRLTFWIGAIVTSFVGTIFLSLFLLAISKAPTTEPPPLIGALLGFGFFATNAGLFYLQYRMMDWWNNKGTLVSFLISRHAFLFGVSLFFFSRLFGFIAATHAALASAN